jgi:C-terminal processing protease CtpA/Prc
MINFAGMKKYILYILSGTLLLLLVSGCKKDPVEDPGEDPVVVPAETIAINQWIYDNMSQYYFWNTQLPTGIDNTKEIDPEAYFYKLVYKTKDYWSYITDDYASLASELNGDPVTMGYYPAFYLVGSNNVMIVVCYVYPGSPAAEAGLERGDLILSIDNMLLDTTNYYTQYSGAKYTVQLGEITNNTLGFTGESLSMTARVVSTDPAVHHEVLDIEGHKIGYLSYVEFIAGENDAFLLELDNIFNEFKTAAISDLIVDLRYNPGGEIDAALHLGSEIAPSAVAASQSIMVNLLYNNDLQAYLQNNNYDSYLHYKFKVTPANINMTRVYFLTTSRSASASELLITGLDPYMQVVQIGEPTYGKYVGSWVMADDNEEWAMMPIVMKYSNISGYTDFIDGVPPDHDIEDDLVDAVPFGDPTDPMIAKAIELATGKSIPVRKAGSRADMNFRQIVPKEMNARNNLYINGMDPVTKKLPF